MSWITTAPLVAGAAVLLFAVVHAVRSGPAPRGRWPFAALLCALFLAFSVYAAANEGPLGFWPEHVRNLWGNQIWFDLLLGIGTALWLLIPRARALGIDPLPWTVLSIATGSVGLLAFLAFVFWKQEQAGRAEPRPQPRRGREA